MTNRILHLAADFGKTIPGPWMMPKQPQRESADLASTGTLCLVRLTCAGKGDGLLCEYIGATPIFGADRHSVRLNMTGSTMHVDASAITFGGAA